MISYNKWAVYDYKDMVIISWSEGNDRTAFNSQMGVRSCKVYGSDNWYSSSMWRHKSNDTRRPLVHWYTTQQQLSKRDNFSSWSNSSQIWVRICSVYCTAVSQFDLLIPQVRWEWQLVQLIPQQSNVSDNWLIPLQSTEWQYLCFYHP